MRLGLAILLPVAMACGSATAANRPTPVLQPQWREPAPEDVLVIDTTKGRIIVEMVPEVAPAHVAQIRKLARAHLYDGLTFFRVIDDFMDQTGDPKNTGEGGSAEPNLKAEFTFKRDAATPFGQVATPQGAEVGLVRSLPVVSQPLAPVASAGRKQATAWATYCPGVAGMARDDDPDSANSQFFLMRSAYPSLDKRYTAWGRVISGLEVVRAIKTGEPVVDPDRMLKVSVLGDLPAGERPKVRVMSTNTPRFRTALSMMRARKGADFSVCDVELPAEVR